YVRVGNCRIKEKIDLSTPVRIAAAQIWLVLYESQELFEGQYLLGVQRGHVAHQFAVDMLIAGFAEHNFVAPGRNEARVRIAYDAEAQEVRGCQDVALGLLIEIQERGHWYIRADMYKHVSARFALNTDPVFDRRSATQVAQ